MLLSTKDRITKWFNWITTIFVGILIFALMVGILAWQPSLRSQGQFEVSKVAPADVVAPRQIFYNSQILTENAQERAANAEDAHYDGPEASTRRLQVQRSKDILKFISIVRNDLYATDEIKTDYLLAIADLSLSPEAVLPILSLEETEWRATVEEVPAALGRLMREEVRDTTLGAARRRVPSFINSDLDDQAASVTEFLVKALVRPNSFLNEERTESLREIARESVLPVGVTLERDEVILRAGDIITAEDVEALEQIGLLQPEWEWSVVTRAIFFTIAILGAIAIALFQLRSQTKRLHQEIALLALAMATWLIAAKFMIVPHPWLPYLYPLAALGMLVTVLVEFQMGLIFTIIFTLIIYYMGNNDTALISYLGMGTFLGVLVLRRTERLVSFLWAGFAVIVGHLLIIAAFRAPFSDFSTSRLVQTFVIATVNGGVSASITLLGYYILGNLFGITTSLQLMELSRPTYPLLRQLLLKAPGTYHHTIVVSNLAERAAEAIGADAFLTRVGAYYHDIGKTVRPYFFVENFVDGAAPHNKLEPLTSAQIIISHVTDGIDLAHKYRLPERIQDFIKEHHGNSRVEYFYRQALKDAAENPDEAEPVDEQDFRYPGPNPESKETAILMLADTCEAAVRAIRPATREELEKLVNKLIDQRVQNGDLNECDLTFNELKKTKEIFIHVLQGVHHPRIAYPDQVKKPQPETSATTPSASPPPQAAPLSNSTQNGAPNGRNGKQAPQQMVEIFGENVHKKAVPKIDAPLEMSG